MVAEAEGRLVGFLLGFISPAGTGYVHLVGIDPEFRRQQVGTLRSRTSPRGIYKCAALMGCGGQSAPHSTVSDRGRLWAMRPSAMTAAMASTTP